MAKCVTALREFTSSLLKMERTWALTVCGLFTGGERLWICDILRRIKKNSKEWDCYELSFVRDKGY